MTQRSSSGKDQFSASTGSTSSTQPLNTVGGSGAQGSATQQVRETASQVTDQAKQQAGQLADQAKQQVTSQLSTQKERAASSIGTVAQALRQTSQQMSQQDQGGVTQYIDRAADQIERLSGYIQNKEVGELVDDVERYARRQPALFLGGAFVLGLLGARFLKSSSQNASSNQYALANRGYQPGSYAPGYTGSTNYGQGYTGTTAYGQSYPDTTTYATGTTGTTPGYTTGTTGTTSGYSTGTTGTTGASTANRTGTTGTTGTTSNTTRQRGGTEGL